MLDYRNMIGTTVAGRYLIISIVGHGGMAVVFNAFDRRTCKTVAIKMLDENNISRKELPSLRKQFANEAKAMSLLSHPGIVKFKGGNLNKSPLYFVMEYVDGITLKEYIKRKKVISQKEVIDFSLQILSALSHIHSKNIVHCDVKPQNILVTKDGKLKLTDFGISRIAGEKPDLQDDKAVGTVYYVSPEQAEGKALDHRSDLYSLGIMMYEMSSGQLPFMDDDIDTVAKMQSAAAPKRPRTINPSISKGMEQIILKVIAKKPFMRFETADAMAKYLEILKKNPNSVFRLQSQNTNAQPSLSGTYHSSSAYSVLIGVCSAFILTLIVTLPIIYFGIFKGVTKNHVSLSLPNLQNISYEDAANQIDERYYDLDIFYVYNSGVKAGTVVYQSPMPNTKLEINPKEEQCKITVGVSADVKELTMIDVISMTPEQAMNALKRQGYKVNVQTCQSDTVKKGLACRTEPECNERVLAGSDVTLYISIGSEAMEITVPDFIGKSENEALKLINSVGLKVGEVKYKASNSKKGTVIEQSIAKGKTVYETTKIDFVVSSGRN